MSDNVEENERMLSILIHIPVVMILDKLEVENRKP